jgi:hypothetical protein
MIPGLDPKFVVRFFLTASLLSLAVGALACWLVMR